MLERTLRFKNPAVQKSFRGLVTSLSCMNSEETDEGELIRRLRTALQPANDAVIANIVVEAREDFPKPVQGTVEVLGRPGYRGKQVHEWFLKWFGSATDRETSV